MKKKLSFILMLIITICTTMLLTACKPNPTLCTWWWHDSSGDEYLDFAANNGVTEIFYCSSRFNDKTNSFIEKANKKNIDVYWLAGEYEWVEEPSLLTSEIDKYLTYQQNYDYKFSGIHLDIEPHQHPDWEDIKIELLQKYVQLTYDLAETYPNMWIEYDIPAFFEMEVEYDGVTKPVFAHVIDNASRVTIMSYRDTAEKIYSISQAEIEYAKSVGKNLNLAVETKVSSEGDNISFAEEGKEIMYQEINKLRELIPSQFGVCIHHIESWNKLKD